MPPDAETSAAGRDARTEAFERERRRLFGLAYRMLGSAAEAEDVVQEAYVRWHGAEGREIASPQAFLTTIVTRLCLDQLKTARARRESYVGLWLPEPLVGEALEAGEALEMADDLSYSLLLMLERLSPLERAAFLLHDVFDVSFADVAMTLGRDEAACRQLAARGRRHVREAGRRFTVAPEAAGRIVEAFVRASRLGDATALEAMLTEDVRIHTDGGGVRPAFLNVVEGREKVVRAFTRLAAKGGVGPAEILYRGTINAAPGAITLESDGLPQATILELDGERIRAIYVVRNPQKLRHLRTFTRS